jgi:diguanylate cyclase (GGDEF)-like protein
MVEVADKEGVKAHDKLRERVSGLTRELDELDIRLRKTCKSFQGAISVLAGMCSPDLAPSANKALNSLKKASNQRTVQPAQLDKAVAEFKAAFLSSTGRTEKSDPEAPPQEVPGEESPARGAAGRHVALALLEGLRLGDADFDAMLERQIVSISGYISKGQVRPAMGAVVDLMGLYRDAQEKRRLGVENALREVLEEVLSTESELTDAFQSAQTKLVEAGRQYDDSLTHSAGQLAKKMSNAGGFDDLKSSVLDHIRSLREGIRSRRANEESLLSQTQKELNQVREVLENTKEQMQQVEKMSERWSREALTDPMTKVLNKRAFSAHLQEAIESLPQSPLSLIVFDIDYFKNINDTFGHQAGDRALKAIAEQAATVLRQNDTLFRYAGDEFVIVLLQTRLKDAAAVAERVRRSAESIRFTWRGEKEKSVSLSLGVSQAQKDDNADSLFQRADEALLEAKQAGRNRVQTK